MSDANANISVSIDTSAALAQLKELQRQISLFHTNVTKSTSAAALAQKDLQKSLIDDINATGKFAASLTRIKTSAESFTDSLERNKFSMREYFRYAAASTKTFGKAFSSEFETVSRVAEERVKTLQTQYIKLGRDANGALQSIAVRPLTLDMKDHATQVALTAQKQALFNQLMKQGSTNLLNFGKNTQWAGRQLMVGFTIPLTLLGSTASKVFMDMEAQALKFKKVYGDLFTPAAETQRALDDVKELGRVFTRYGVAVSETMGLAAEAAAAGFQGSDLMRQTTEATRLSVLGEIDRQQALKTTIALQNAFGLSSDELASKINFLNAVENQTVTSLNDITEAIPRVAPVIKQLGGNVEDLAYFITAMKEGGINAAEGANALKSGLSAIINPTGQAAAMFEKLNINIQDIVVKNKGNLKGTIQSFASALDDLDPLNRAQALEQLFGRFQLARVSALFANIAKDGSQASRVLGIASTSMEDLAATADNELGLIEQSASTKFKAAVESLKLSIAPVGEEFLKAVTPIVEFFGNIADKFNNLSDRSKRIITILVGVVGAVGPVFLMTFGLLANGIANIIKLFLTLRMGFQRITGQSNILAEQTQYLTEAQAQAAAVAHSLDQTHAKLIQTFNIEAGALENLARVYERADRAGMSFAARNPMSMAPGFTQQKKYAKGVVSVPGPKGAGDVVPAMLSPGEAVIPTEQNKKYGSLVQGIIADNIPGFVLGTTQVSSPARRQSSNLFVAGHITGFETNELPRTVSLLIQEFDRLSASANEQDRALSLLIQETLDSRLGIQNFSEVIDGVITGVPSSETIRSLAEKRAAMLGGSIGTRITGNARNEAFRQIKIGEPLTFRQADEALPSAREAIETGKLPSGKPMQEKYLEELKHFINSTSNIVTEQDKVTFALSNMRKTIADQIASTNKDITREELSIEVDRRMLEIEEELIRTGAATRNSQTGVIDSLDDYKAELVFATSQLRSASRENVSAATLTGDAISPQVVRVAQRGKPKDMPNVTLNRQSPDAPLRIPSGEAYYRRNIALRSALEGQIPGLQGAGISQANAVLNGLEDQLQTNSPSRRTMQIGEDVARGLEVGMQSRQDDVARVAENLGDTAVTGTRRGRRGVSTVGNVTPGQPISTVATGAPYIPPVAAPIILRTSTEESLKNAEAQAKNTEALKDSNTITKTTTSTISQHNGKLLGASMALSSLAGVGTMFGGTVGELSSKVMALSSAMFALQMVTQLVTREKFLEVVSRRASIASEAMGAASRGGGALAARGGIKGLFPLLGRLTLGLTKFIGPIGIATTVVGGLLWAFNRYKKAQENASDQLNKLGIVAKTTKEEIKTYADILGFVPNKRPSEMPNATALRSDKRTLVDKIRDDDNFLKQNKKQINLLKTMTQEEGMAALTSKGLMLRAAGAGEEQVRAILTAIAEESGRKDLILNFKSMKFSKQALDEVDKSVKSLAKNINQKFLDSPYEAELAAAKEDLDKFLASDATEKAKRQKINLYNTRVNAIKGKFNNLGNPDDLKHLIL